MQLPLSITRGSATGERISTNPLSNNSIRSSSREIMRPVYAWSRSELFSLLSSTRRTVAQPAAKPAAMSSSESPTYGMGRSAKGAQYRDTQDLIIECYIIIEIIGVCDSPLSFFPSVNSFEELQLGRGNIWKGIEKILPL